MATAKFTAVLLIALIFVSCGGDSKWIAPTLSQTPVLTPSASYGELPFDMEAQQVIHASNGKYYWYYHYSDNISYRISVTISDSKDGPWTRSTLDPIFQPGPVGSWDDGGVACATVSEEPSDGKFYMFYCGMPASNYHAWSIGLAVAESPEGPFTRLGMMVPDFGYVNSVLYHDGLYWMYSNYPVVGQTSAWSYMLGNQFFDSGFLSVATSPNRKGPWTVQQVVMSPLPNSWETPGLTYSNVFPYRDGFAVSYCGSASQFGFAFSAGGLKFTRSEYNPVVFGATPLPLATRFIFSESNSTSVTLYYSLISGGLMYMAETELPSLPPL